MYRTNGYRMQGSFCLFSVRESSQKGGSLNRLLTAELRPSQMASYGAETQAVDRGNHSSFLCTFFQLCFTHALAHSFPTRQILFSQSSAEVRKQAMKGLKIPQQLCRKINPPACRHNAKMHQKNVGPFLSHIRTTA